ncbi:hypothetical protein Smp_187010 [Schistosoma mansoni]|uniref:hypothetical protein n=1 Tax=Schistosoma mansoni TaxID=6183 RepID=UPI00022DC431|nr:hypothetical protein Smp_187010 [Schistosoma mansoni]|eukprot:XP_018652097.1 hypothetical protein Smp_187010 [Schistosoma mansoni]
MQRVPGLLQDEMARKKSVLSYHYYCWLLESTPATEHMPSWKRHLCDQLLLNYAFKNVRSIVQSTGGGRFLTEFGLCLPDGNPDSINTVECNAVLNAADRNFESWTYWDGYELFSNLNVENISVGFVIDIFFYFMSNFLLKSLCTVREFIIFILNSVIIEIVQSYISTINCRSTCPTGIRCRFRCVLLCFYTNTEELYKCELSIVSCRNFCSNVDSLSTWNEDSFHPRTIIL